MGLMSRLTTLIKAKVNSLLERAENPQETLDYAYERMREQVRKVRQGIVEVVTARRRLEFQADRIRQDIARLEEQARQALALGREDLARLALQRKQMALQQLQGLDQEIARLEAEQERLTLAEQRLAAKVEAFRTQKELLKAQYSAAEAQVRIGEALTGVSEEMADLEAAVERAQRKTERMRARASAIDELARVGVLEDFTGRQDPIGQELARLTAQQNVEQELEALRRSLGPGGSGPALHPGREG